MNKKTGSGLSDCYNIRSQDMDVKSIDSCLASLRFNPQPPIGKKKLANIHVPTEAIVRLWEKSLNKKFYMNALVLGIALIGRYDYPSAHLHPELFRRIFSQGYYGDVRDLCWFTSEVLSINGYSVDSVEGLAIASTMCITREICHASVENSIAWEWVERHYCSLEKSCSSEFLKVLLSELVKYNRTVKWWLIEPCLKFTEALSAIFYHRHHRLPVNWSEINSSWKEEGDNAKLNHLLYGYIYGDDGAASIIANANLSDYAEVDFDYFRYINRSPVAQSEDGRLVFKDKCHFTMLYDVSYDIFFEHSLSVHPGQQCENRQRIAEIVERITGVNDHAGSSDTKPRVSDATSGENPESE